METKNSKPVLNHKVSSGLLNVLQNVSVGTDGNEQQISEDFDTMVERSKTLEDSFIEETYRGLFEESKARRRYRIVDGIKKRIQYNMTRPTLFRHVSIGDVLEISQSWKENMRILDNHKRKVKF